MDDDGNPVTHWDGRTTEPHPVTGKEVPDETARTPVHRYTNPRKAKWPEADFIVGNPPFIGPALMRQALGDGYTETVRALHNDVGESSDFVMYWWNHAAELARDGKVKRFGFVTTNSLRQKFNRRVLEKHMSAKKPLSLVFAIPDHPWVDSADGAAVRIAMTAAAACEQPGLLHRVVAEKEGGLNGYDVELETADGVIHSDLTVGVSVGSAAKLRANGAVCFQGVILVGEGFRLTPLELPDLGLDPDGLPPVVRPHASGKDVLHGDRGNLVIDLYGLSEEDVRADYPRIYQHLAISVRPHRLQNRDRQRRERWWLFGRSNAAMRSALHGLSRFIAVVETSKHKPFVFLPGQVCPDHKLYVIASDDACVLGVLSARLHQLWARHAGGTLEDRPTWKIPPVSCLSPFPPPRRSSRRAFASWASNWMRIASDSRRSIRG